MSRVIFGDCRESMRIMVAAGVKVQMCVTSPPYWGLRDYGHPGQLGLEPTPAEYVANMVEVFRLVRDLLADDGVLWLNLGDSYTSGGRDKWNAGDNHLGQHGAQHMMARAGTPPGLKPKDLVGIPWRVAFALQADGWYLRCDVVWSKPNPMPESVTDRPTKAHEYIFLLSKNERYYYDADAIKEPMSMSSVERLTQPNLESQIGSDRVPGKTNGNMKAVGKVDKQRGHSRRHAGFNDRWDAMEKAEQCSGMRNKRSVWTVATVPFSGRVLLGDKIDTVSPDCPVHGDSDLARIGRAQALDDAQQAAAVRRNSGKGVDHDQEPSTGLFATTSLNSGAGCPSTNGLSHTDGSTVESKTKTDQPQIVARQVSEQTTCRTNRIADSDLRLADSSDLPDLSCSDSASSHSTESRKTALSLGTTPACTACAQTIASIGGTSNQPCLCGSVERTPESNSVVDSVADVPGSDPSAQTASSNANRCTCSHYTPDHFATFPPALIEPCILAGSRPGDVVLDPFFGSGTTGQVAQQLGRKWIGCELNEAYAPLQAKRTAQQGMVFA